MPKLGRALGADPTAVYRHFASKDDLILAIADHLIEEAMDGPARARLAGWRRSIDIDPAAAPHLSRPSGSGLALVCRTTQRAAEMRVVDMHPRRGAGAGFEGVEAA